MKKGNNIFWGIVLILGAVLILLNSFGVYLGFGPLKLWIGIILAAALVKSIISIQVEGICFSAAFLVIIFANELGLGPVNWLQILLVAVLLSVGLNLLFGNKIKKMRREKHKNDAWAHGYEQVIDDKDYDHVEVGVRCGSVVKYVDCDNFVSGNLSVSFGELVVYFDNAVIQNASAVIQADVSFGAMKLYIPKEWKVENNITSSFAGVDERGKNQWTEGGKILYLKGNASFGAVEIYYI